MSEYQFYDFYAIDKALSSAQQKKVASYSSRSNSNSRRATFVYNYGDFRYKIENVLYDFFDIAIYIANWGTRRLLMKFPANLVSLKDLKAYEYEYKGGDGYEYIRVSQKKEFIIVDLYADNEVGHWVEGEGWLDDLLSVREQVLNGDYRVLYLAWLHFATLTAEFAEEEETEPPVPANLGKLDVGLKNFIKYWGINKDVIAAASKASKVEKAIKAPDLSQFIGKLSTKEKEEYLTLLLTDENQAQYQLKKKLQDFLAPKKKDTKKGNARTTSEIVEASVKEKKSRIKKQKKAAEKAHIKKMEGIGEQQAEMWQELRDNADLKTAKGYENATNLLKDLKAYGVYAKEEKKFEKKLAKILEVYGSSVAFRRRLSKVEII